ncbi:uncharacterized protein Z520_02222 [Fonsecaea multimorphosa CBS 102226]|uniref:TEA domain-containing protein n=1 Tax=Fonsecaea multimorphosa CBS 102226 TaxID=1442371 RepID=A0A0D2KZ42_9EURO|nr:uncharacterized protein Z520_02222 [Fonsecaea multimorphosa CBS 102226]KIY02084.1 hypothetical protein Z520_02222 [Fonsecaea multimorphosa CBS 102226]OAL29283.1 hypothetical protein AYO22_02177 [Fonsecaea multimorphosa]
MERLHSGVLAPVHLGDVRSATGRLAVSSGNAQLLPVTHGDGIENQYPLPGVDALGGHIPHFPIPTLKLGSNDGSNGAFAPKRKRHTLKPHRSKQLGNPDRPYLHHPKYLEYRSRPRQEIGDDGKAIWPDNIEAAFQDALVHIKPMGRKKCSQRGKPYGRNMLIAEWIYRATGQERKRKQVSSHIQVLDKHLKGIPEWDRLLKPGDDDDDTSPSEGHKFYHNSIEHMVNEQKARSKPRQLNDGVWDDELEGHAESFAAETLAGDLALVPRVERLNFEMWVSSPVDHETALHYYTGLKPTKLMPFPLEELTGWRLSFPHLKSLVDHGKRLDNCDLILLNASFKLMDDFPPRHSKLGICFELKYPDPLWQDSQQQDAKPNKWSCVTYMYREGVLITEPTREECQTQDQWSIRPFFQSKWWASTFTSLTEAKKVAEDSKNPEAIELANEQSRTFFRGLSIMQEIYIVRSSSSSSNGDSGFGERDMKQRESRKRTAILLWQFSEAPTDSVGVTTWQNLIPPPDRLATNSPFPHGVEMSLPPLSMDSIVDCSPGDVSSFESNNASQQHFQPEHEHGHGMSYDLYDPDAMDEELCQDGFMALKQHEQPPLPDFGHHLQSPFDVVGSNHEFTGLDPSIHDTFALPPHASLPPWSPQVDEQDEALRNALLAASGMDLDATAAPQHPSPTPRPQHEYSPSGEHQRHTDTEISAL